MQRISSGEGEGTTTTTTKPLGSENAKNFLGGVQENL